jgi:hypothetical protein
MRTVAFAVFILKFTTSGSANPIRRSLPRDSPKSSGVVSQYQIESMHGSFDSVSNSGTGRYPYVRQIIECVFRPNHTEHYRARNLAITSSEQ